MNVNTLPPPEEESQADRDRLVLMEPYGYVNQPGPLTIKTPYFGLKRDWAYPETCKLVLTNVLGSGMWVRYYKHQITHNVPCNHLLPRSHPHFELIKKG